MQSHFADDSYAPIFRACTRIGRLVAAFQTAANPEGFLLAMSRIYFSDQTLGTVGRPKADVDCVIGWLKQNQGNPYQTIDPAFLELKTHADLILACVALTCEYHAALGAMLETNEYADRWYNLRDGLEGVEIRPRLIGLGAT